VVSDTNRRHRQRQGQHKFGVIVDGNQIELYINDQLVETIWDDTIKSRAASSLRRHGDTTWPRQL
jgi:hypothetical protein